MVPHYDANVAYFWVVVWILSCGIPIAIGLSFPEWVPVPPTEKKPDGH